MVVFRNSPFMTGPKDWIAFTQTISFYQLLSLALLSSVILAVRFQTTGRITVHLFWVMAAVGFVVLACDDLLGWHESIDKAFHKFFNLKETSISDRIDDAIVVTYAIIGFVAIWYWRHEVGRYTQVNWFLAIGMILVVTMIAVDTIVNRYDILPAIMGRGPETKSVFRFGRVVEDGVKVVAEGVLITAFIGYLYHSLIERKRLAQAT